MISDGGATIDSISIAPIARNSLGRFGSLGRISAIICNVLCNISSHNAPLIPFHT